MKLECPNCGQHVEITDGDFGRTVACPSCRQAVNVPRSVEQSDAGDETRLPTPAPLQPSPSAPVAKKRMRGPLGCELYFWLFVALAAGGFYYAMHQWHTSPRETLSRLVTSAQRLAQGEPTPEPQVEEESATPSVTAAPKRDPIRWLVEHKPYWPNEVVLLQPFEFPAVSNGQPVGSLVVPAGTTVKVKEITPTEVGADFMGGDRHVPVGATDLLARADAAFKKAEIEARQGRGTVALNPPPPVPKIAEDPAEIREATLDEIGKGLGALYTHQATTFRIFAPTANAVSVVLYNDFSGSEGRAVRPLRREPNGVWDTSVAGELLGKYYNFLLDENDAKRAREVLDPYAVNAVASSSRGRVSSLTTPVSRGPELQSATDAIIYEMHVRDFTIAPSAAVKNPGLYLGLTEPGTHLPDDESIKTGLDHLIELGVTHVELMPVQDFENDEETRSYNWGYITSAFFSPEGMFATNPNDFSRVRELKTLINALHARGIGVILDVVYNHTSGNASLMSIAPEYYYRHAPGGSLANGSGCGNEIKSEAPMTRRLIIDSLKFWAKEYGADGFRFDLMALIDQETIRQADRELRAINPGIVLFGEPWTGGTSPLPNKSDKSALRQIPAGAFNDDFRNALKGQPDGGEPGWIQDGSKRDALKTAMLVSDWFASPSQSINYMTCHDNLVLWDKLVASMPDAADPLRIETMKLGYLALLTSQGVPFIHAGEEFARSKGGNNNSFESPDSVNEIDWNLKRDHKDLFDFVRDVIALRKAHPMFRLRTKPQIASRVRFPFTSDNRTLMFTVDGGGVPGETWKRVCVVLNSADETDSELILPGGEWLVALDEHGAVSVPRAVSGKLAVRHKSGVVLYQL